MINPNILTENLFEKIFELNSNNKIGATTITVFTFILYKCENPQKEIVLSDYEMARELGLSRQTVIAAKNKLKLLGLLDYQRNPGFPNRFILNGNEFPNEKLKITEFATFLFSGLLFVTLVTSIKDSAPFPNAISGFSEQQSIGGTSHSNLIY